MKLRARKPYTCRFTINGAPCAAYLADADGDYCAQHTAAVKRFEAGPTTASCEPEAWTRGPLWP